MTKREKWQGSPGKKILSGKDVRGGNTYTEGVVHLNAGPFTRKRAN